MIYNTIRHETMHTTIKLKRNEKFQTTKQRKVLQQSNLITRCPGRNMGQMGHRHDPSHPVAPDANHSCAEASKIITRKVQRYELWSMQNNGSWVYLHQISCIQNNSSQKPNLETIIDMVIMIDMMFAPVPTSNARQGVGSHLHLPIALQSLLKHLGQFCLGQRINYSMCGHTCRGSCWSKPESEALTITTRHG